MIRRYPRNRAARLVSLGLVAFLPMITSVVVGEHAAASTTDRCSALSHTHVTATTITHAAIVAATATVPEYCQVDGYVTTPGDRVVSSNQVIFRVGLPMDWNSGFYFQGVGGLAGHLGSLDAGLQRGYASASTDTGHQGSTVLGSPELDGSWALNNLPKQIDYGYRGVHVATVAAKEIVRAYYHRAPRHSVFSGCSNGGRQGLMEAQRFPADYDGVISQSPAFNVIDTFITWIWQMQAQLSSPGRWVSPAQLPALSAASLQRNDAGDGLVDGLISNPAKATFQPGPLVANGSLTDEQVKTVQAIYDGRGRLAEGHPIGHEEGWQTYITGQVPPIAGPDGHLVFPFSRAAPSAYTFTNEFLRYFFFNDPTFDLTSFNLHTDLPILDRLRWMLDATSPDLTAFRAHDGKLLMTQGWADPALSAFAPVSYYDKVAGTMGAVSTPGFFRLFMAPGMFHCAGGPGPNQFDSLTAMERWLNNGVAPDAIVAINPASGRTRPLCRYPTVAVYDGSGSIDESTNFTCGPNPNVKA